MLRVLMLAITGLLTCAGAALAQTESRPPVSQCQAIARNIPGVMFASFEPPFNRPSVQLAQATARE